MTNNHAITPQESVRPATAVRAAPIDPPPPLKTGNILRRGPSTPLSRLSLSQQLRSSLQNKTSSAPSPAPLSPDIAPRRTHAARARRDAPRAVREHRRGLAQGLWDLPGSDERNSTTSATRTDTAAMIVESARVDAEPLFLPNLVLKSVSIRGPHGARGGGHGAIGTWRYAGGRRSEGILVSTSPTGLLE